MNILLEIAPPAFAVMQSLCGDSFNNNIKMNYEYSHQQSVISEEVIDDKPDVTQVNKNQARELAILKESKLAGSKAGLKERYGEITEILMHDSTIRLLDDVYDFTHVQNGNIVLPVISEVKATRELAKSKKKLKTSGKSWKIISPARISTGKLTWRTYLHQDYVSSTKYRNISDYFLPRNQVESKLFKNGYCQGYKLGYKQANDLFSSQLSLLNRDFMGMWRFKSLVIQGIVSEPVVKKNRLGVLVSDDKVLIDRTDIVIQKDSKFEKPNNWGVIFK